MDAWLGGAQDQLQGQIASAKIPLSRMISPQLYWVMSGDDFTLDINNPDDPKILCVGNNPDRQNIYGAALGLYNSRIVKLINKKGQLKSGIIIDELPTIYFKGLDNLIATARSNKVAVLLCFQDFSQLKRDYGDKEAAVVMNTVGNIFSGQVVGETAKTLSERFGKVLQKRQSMTLSRSDKSTSISTQLDSLIPASKISTLTQGMFVGAVADNFDERIEQKIFHCEIVVDNEKVKAETARYKKIPQITDFTDENGTDHMKQVVQENYERISNETADPLVRSLYLSKTAPICLPVHCHDDLYVDLRRGGRAVRLELCRKDGLCGDQSGHAVYHGAGRHRLHDRHGRHRTRLQKRLARAARGSQPLFFHDDPLYGAARRF